MSSTYFNFHPDWGQQVSISYTYETLISASEKTKEQRKPLSDTPLRKIRIKLLETTNVSEIINRLQRMKDTVIAVPIYSEPINPTTSGSLNTLSTINCNDVSKFYNLNKLAKKALVVDLLNAIEPILLDLVSVTANSVTFYPAINSAFMGATTVIYPTIFCALETEFNSTEFTDSLSNLELTFIEYPGI